MKANYTQRGVLDEKKLKTYTGWFSIVSQGFAGKIESQNSSIICGKLNNGISVNQKCLQSEIESLGCFIIHGAGYFSLKSLKVSVNLSATVCILSVTTTEILFMVLTIRKTF